MNKQTLYIVGFMVGLVIGALTVDCGYASNMDWRCLQRCIARGSHPDYCQAMCSR